MSLPMLLVIAGHDSSGRAGVSADREAALAAGVEIETVVTAWTIQDEAGVRELGARPSSDWLPEALALLEDGPAAIKFGLLPGLEALEGARTFLRHALAADPAPAWVLDPVIAASSGRSFLDEQALAYLRGELLPLGPVLTPNRPELEQLSELPLADGPLEGAARLLDLGCQAVVAKGGHAEEDPVRDLVLERGPAAAWIEQPRLPGPGIRGSGCRHATFLAARLAGKAGLVEAARGAAHYVSECIAGADQAGKQV